MKRGFIPKLDCFLYFDYSQIEYRILAYYLSRIGYDEMAQDFRSGLDPHTQTTKDLLSIDDPSDEDRQFGKTFNFASIYGAGPKKIAAMLSGAGITLPEGMTTKDLWFKFYEVRPIRKLSNPPPRFVVSNYKPGMIEQEIQRKGYVRTLWGRHLWSEDSPHKVLNYLIQGCAADLMRHAFVNVAEALEGFESHLVAVIHDEMILDCRDSEVEQIVKMVPALMDAPYIDRRGNEVRISDVVPVETSIEISYTNWAEKEEYIEEGRC